MAQINPLLVMQMAPALLVLVKELADVVSPGGMTKQELRELAHAVMPLLVKVNPRLQTLQPKALAQILCGLLDVQQGLAEVQEALRSEQ